MSTPTDTGRPKEHPPARTEGALVAALVDAGVVVAWFLVVGLVAGWVWATVTPLPEVTKTGENATVPSEELVKQVGMDGWYVVIAVAAGVLSGILLLWWRRRDPLLSVVLVAAGAGVGSWVMLRAGQALGPGDAVEALSRLPDGSTVPEQLHLSASGAMWVWPAAAAFGALLFLWVLAKPEQGESDTVILR